MKERNKEHGLIYTGDSILAIHAGTKTMTRRVMTYRNSLVDGVYWNKEEFAMLDFDETYLDPGPSVSGNPGPFLKVQHKEMGTLHRVYPRIQVEDMIWGKETWARTMATAYRQSPGVVFTPNPDCPEVGVVYKAGWTRCRPGPWKSPMFMHKWASRTWTKVLAVRPERLQDISPEDVIAEGIPKTCDCRIVRMNNLQHCEECQDSGLWHHDRSPCIDLWDKINGKKYPWADNCWVWVYEFEKVDR